MSQTIVITDTDNPIEVDWTTYRGNTFLREFNLKENGALVDLTGSTFEMIVTDVRGTVLATLALGTGITVVSTGRIRCYVVDTAVATWPADCVCRFTFKWTRPTSPVVKRFILKGKI